MLGYQIYVGGRGWIASRGGSLAIGSLQAEQSQYIIGVVNARDGGQ